MESRKDKFERWAKQWDGKLPNLAKALRSKELQDQLAFIENFNAMNTPISPEAAEIIEKEADDLYSKLDEAARDYDHYEYGLPMFEKCKQPIIDLLTEKYQQFEQAKKALEEIIGCGLGRYTSAQDYKNCVDRIAGNLLATWKEEGNL